MPQRHRHAASTLLLVLLLCAAALWAGRSTADANQRATATRWEYGMLSFQGNDGIFWTSGQAVFMEAPRRDAEVIGGQNRLRLVRPLSMIHLHPLGDAGWEIICAVPGGGESESYLMRRPR